MSAKTKHRYPIFNRKPDGSVEAVDPADFFMTTARHVNILKLLEARIEDLRNGKLSIDEPYRQMILDSKQVPVGEDHPAGGTGMFPKASEYWYIGTFGSVWLDCKVGPEILRIAFTGSDFVVQGQVG